MFGFSLPKILLLVFLIVIVWNVFKLIEKRNEKKKRDKNSYFSKGKQQEEALIECEICGNFYSNDVPGGCPVCRSKG